MTKTVHLGADSVVCSSPAVAPPSPETCMAPYRNKCPRRCIDFCNRAERVRLLMSCECGGTCDSRPACLLDGTVAAQAPSGEAVRKWEQYADNLLCSYGQYLLESANEQAAVVHDSFVRHLKAHPALGANACVKEQQG